MVGFLSDQDLGAAVQLGALVAIAWPLSLFVCGSYSTRGLSTWASGIGELGASLRWRSP
jgi:hypothetical protein